LGVTTEKLYLSYSSLLLFFCEMGCYDRKLKNLPKALVWYKSQILKNVIFHDCHIQEVQVTSTYFNREL